MTYKDLLFRRQFLITPDRCEELEHWQHKTLGKFHIYAHPDIELNVIDENHEKPKMALIGYMIDPNFPEQTNIDILRSIYNSINSIDGICKYLYDMAGRFVLVIDDPKDTFIFHDACGLRSVFYTQEGKSTYIGSQPLVFKYVMPIKYDERFHIYNESKYKKSNIEHWIPSGCSLFKDIFHLVPNHYLRLSTFEQVRYWPNKELQDEPLEYVAGKVSELLERLMKAGNYRFSLAFSLTAGFDSRTLLSACKAIAPDIYFYTLQYRKLTLLAHDIAIPNKLLGSLGYDHHVIDCRKKTDPSFAQVYALNTPISHNNDWGDIAYGMMVGGYPSDRIAVKGNCSEAGRSYYRTLYETTGNHQPLETPEQIIDLIQRGWYEIPFVCEQIRDWYNQTKPVSEVSGIDILDLFFWEHRMGSWQAQSQLEWDLVQEVYTPFNHRRLLEIMLSTPIKYRRAPEHLLHKEICKTLWPQVLEQPINPPSPVKDWFKNNFERLGLEKVARIIYTGVVSQIG
ncbi:hypothetical protein I8748_30650 [Nostoc sp. CENA67]|uniref:Glutamine amidotransferase type-2 domain-containing protein n=1 Tax=Amazonocrinis nigriterrae CENA67 TaxID=2794033 RepID=A0A8J7HZT2_9NOST|nr:hypothetical protein [Amazonocrinis nigriterrae]MBH8566462.1 hypothetical protein [Amazonocrinis nigriterrae CENA67]